MVSKSATMLPKVRSNPPPENVNSGTAKTQGPRSVARRQLTSMEGAAETISHLALEFGAGLAPWPAGRGHVVLILQSLGR